MSNRHVDVKDPAVPSVFENVTIMPSNMVAEDCQVDLHKELERHTTPFVGTTSSGRS